MSDHVPAADAPQSQWFGYWTTDAPLTPDQAAEDRPLLEALSSALELPATVSIRTLDVWVNGRVYEWRRERAW